MDQVTLSWSVKNLITVNLMVLVFGAGVALAAHLARKAGAEIIPFPQQQAQGR